VRSAIPVLAEEIEIDPQPKLVVVIKFRDAALWSSLALLEALLHRGNHQG